MRNICFVKQPWSPVWSWKSTLFTTAREMIETFRFKTANASLLLALRGDVWVMEDSECRSRDKAAWCGDEEATRVIYKQTPQTKWHDVPWTSYDMVLSGGRIVPPEIIEAFPHVLWVLLEGEHTVWKRDPGLYDLFWDYTLSSGASYLLYGLPSVVSIPFMVNPAILCSLVPPVEKEPLVFLPSRMVRGHVPYGPINVRHPDIPREIAGMPTVHMKQWNLGSTTAAVAAGVAEPAIDYFRTLAKCKYVLNVRPGGEIGQPIIEGAALGAVVVTTPELYDIACHPFCIVEDFDSGVEAIRAIKANPHLYAEILNYQLRALYERFWIRPMGTLQLAAAMKKEQYGASN